MEDKVEASLEFRSVVVNVMTMVDPEKKVSMDMGAPVATNEVKEKTKT